MTPKRSLPRLSLFLTRMVAASLAVSGVFAQVAPTAPTSDASAPAPRGAVVASTNESAARDEIVSLSPFEVVADNKGYFASNSMSGTRFNTKVEDLAASLTVVTKEQMQDFAMLDINDVFLYTAGTEGTGTYTDYVMDRNGQLTDNVQANPTNANRVRGIAAANQSYGNYETQGRVPMDPLVVDGIEVSRGPNANVFGLGMAAGTVNQVPVSANLSRDKTRVETRGDSFGGYRSTLDVNRVLKPGVLAIRASAGFQHDAFIRKPSGVNTVRYNGMVKFQPFQNTKISAAYLRYRMNGNRPNFTPPRDYVTDWVNSGAPTWDPVAEVVHLNGQTIDKNGVVTGGRAVSPITADSNIPSYIAIARLGGVSTRANMYVDENGLSYWSAPSTNSLTATQVTPAANGQPIRMMQSSIFGLGSSQGRYSGQPLWTTTSSVGPHGPYDWSRINLSSVNRLMDRTDTYNVSIDQLFFNTPRQMLAGQLGFFREDSQRYVRTPIGNGGTSGQTGQLFVDVNEKLLDGTPNPFFLRPYIGVGEPVTRWIPSKWDSYRAQLAYKIDLTREKSWLKWLGLHQVTGYDEYKYRITRQFGFRDALTSDHSWTQTGYPGFQPNQGRAVQANVSGSNTQGSTVTDTISTQAGANITRQYMHYYVGDAKGYDIDFAPHDFTYGSYPFVWGGYTLASGAPIAGSGRFFSDPAQLGLLATTDNTGGANNVKQIIKTPGVVIQSQFLDGKIVTTLGQREDKVYSKNGNLPALTNGNTQHDYNTDNGWKRGDYLYNSGKTKTFGVVVRPFRDFGFIKEAANSDSLLPRLLADAARGFSFTYNQADNFYPQTPAVDLFLQPLPNVTGKGKDYGFWLNLFDNRVVLRFNHYISRQLNARDGDANTVAQRVIRIDLDVASDAYELATRALAWNQLLHPDWSAAQVKQAASDQMKIPVDIWDTLAANFRAGTVAATNDIWAAGNEAELNVNPTKNWTVSASVTQQTSKNMNVSDTVQRWIDQRMPVWTTLVDPNTNPSLGTGPSQGWLPDANNPNHLWWKHVYSGTQTPSDNFASFVQAPYSVIQQTAGKSRKNVREYNVRISSSIGLAAFTENRFLKNVKVGGAFRWEDKAIIDYYGLQQPPAIVTALDPNKPIWDKSHYYVDAFVSYRTKLFADKVGATFQFNVRNIGENGRLQPIGAFPDGTPNAYRIVDPQQFILQASFDL